MLLDHFCGRRRDLGSVEGSDHVKFVASELRNHTYGGKIKAVMTAGHLSQVVSNSRHGDMSHGAESPVQVAIISARSCGPTDPPLNQSAATLPPTRPYDSGFT